jgi:hypothetical protein
MKKVTAFVGSAPRKKAARFDFNVGTGNLTIDHLAGGEQLLASGTLQYLESQELN